MAGNTPKRDVRLEELILLVLWDIDAASAHCTFTVHFIAHPEVPTILTEGAVLQDSVSQLTKQLVSTSAYLDVVTAFGRTRT